MKRRITPPKCMGQRMTAFGLGWRLQLPQLGMTVYVDVIAGRFNAVIHHRGEVIFSVPRTGPQAAANAAERWLVARAELTLKLAGRRVAA